MRGFTGSLAPVIRRWRRLQNVDGPVSLRYAAKTDVGMRREHNEDCFGILEEDKLLLVADGMGGHAAGEVASSLATIEVSSFYHYRARPTSEKPWPYAPDPSLSELANRLVCAVKVANRRIYETATSEGGRRGMGTTLAAVAIEGREICIAHVGDSRVYRIRGGAITRMTRDHSLLEQMKEINPDMTPEEEERFPHKNVIVRALGLYEEVEAEVKQDRLEHGDVYLLCSDGLSGHLADAKMLELVGAGDDLSAAVRKLVDHANAAGGNDNVTVVLLRCG